jgi:hypothetical protein
MLSSPARPWRVAVVVAVMACASSAGLDDKYARGIKDARAGHWKTAMESLESFTAKACAPPRPDARCREAYLALGRGNERRGTPAYAWVAFDTALALPPHNRDAAVREDLARAQQELEDQLKQPADQGPIILRYRDEMPDEYTARSVMVSLDLSPVYTKEKDASELRSPDYTRVFGGPVRAGSHVLAVDAEHRCKPGEAVKCAPSTAHRSWTFETQAKVPMILEVRAYAEPGEGDGPARPTLEMHVH